MTYCVTRDCKSRELCEGSPFEFSSIYSTVRGNAGRPQITSVVVSRGKVLKRLVELKEVVCRFLQDSGSQLYQHFV
jgi:hypothetical protein